MWYPKRRHKLTRLGLVLAVGLLCLLPVWAMAQEEAAEEPAEVDPEAALEDQLGLVPSLPLATDENTDETAEVGGVAATAIDLFDKGGPFMWPLLACSIFGLALIIERSFTLTRARINTRRLMDRILGSLRDNGVDGAIEVCTRTRGPIAAILHSGLMRADKGPEAVEKAIESAGVIEMAYLQRSMIWLSTLATIAPLLGFLGTVSGMINAFAAIAVAEQVSAKLVASGIQEALITTATGLMIAIPIQTAHNFFVSKIDKFITEMEESSVELVDTLVDIEHQQSAKGA